MLENKRTASARVGMFPLGDMVSPILPPINATTLIAPSLERLAPIADNSLLRTADHVMEGLYYGGVDTPTTLSLAKEIARLEGGNCAVLSPSGQAAINLVLSALVQSGDHILVSDCITYTTKWLLDRHFAPLGVTVDYFTLHDSHDLERLLRCNTRLVFWESPGSFLFEVVDPRPIVKLCRSRNIITMIDNTWSASHFFNPFQHGIDVSVLSLTKTHAAIAGVSLGAAVTVSEDLYNSFKTRSALLGDYVSSSACSDAAKSMSTLSLRLDAQQHSASAILSRLAQSSVVHEVFHPASSKSPYHMLFQTLYSGFNSLISVEFSLPPEILRDRINKLSTINVGYGWGGAVSLVNLFAPAQVRTIAADKLKGPCARFYIGLEDPSDILADFDLLLRED
ncbi:trans-sulfuration enzyme family protein [Neorhizobium sp. DAR64860/K0K1]|uniref:trans-sulfuration enzyme family protein n=1 Tax=Neorhizobium sp. DAR64860/K0K1 TaxID=3421955 RepID=UPI003D2C72C1